jgi:2-keto-3-deoxy-L-arabinonate dehydratase
VLYAFWDDKGRLDEAAMRLQVERCLAVGAHGITVLGLVTEIHKMSREERIALVRMVGGLVDGRVPYSVAVCEPSIRGQIDFVHEAAEAGADWVILQPPPVKGIGEAALLEFFTAVADASPVPVAIQNNPVNLDVWLSNDALVKLATDNTRVCLVKGEGPALAVAALTQRLGSATRVFAGHGGVEFHLNMAGGCVGLIPAPELLDRQVRIYELYRDETPLALAEATRLHGEILPWIVMMTRGGVEPMLYYGKHLMARRIGLPAPKMRAPTITANALGLAEIDRLHAMLGPLGE